ncbi:MAG: riboflavin synthase subunit beta [Mangrovimonas sp.]|nr:riboflavin synthase subunit beta [Mangrovimonas sp.]MCB0432267.1 riboflavin synthase subunit beta [Mangrovimonas sp.]MCB0439297.1 riboflavin synthase subunit beta [Mangrovimonas sp.]HPF96872.1 riboflavin synthase subunit beta [Mangrovimonas sp.]
MGLFKVRKNKRFSYTPKYYNGEGNPYEMKHKFDDYRQTVGNNSGLKRKIVNAYDDYTRNPNKEANKRVLIIIAVLILVFLFVIDFDLSIFLKK